MFEVDIINVFETASRLRLPYKTTLERVRMVRACGVLASLRHVLRATAPCTF